MDEQLAAVHDQLAQLTIAVNALIERVEKQVTDLGEFAERFEDVMSQVESERRLDLQDFS